MNIINFFRFRDKGLGKQGEEIAVKYLKKKGYKIMEKNYRNEKGKQLGEIDIIAFQKKEIVFVEVKTRQLEKYQSVFPEENITQTKLCRLNKIASFYLRQNNLWDFSYRFDAVSVWISQDGKSFKIKQLENIFL